MKLLTNFIQLNEVEEDILNRVYFHTCIEFKLEHNLYPYIIESLGKFDNAGVVVKHIIDELKKSFKSQIIDCTDDNVYFKYINIIVNKNDTGHGSYVKYNNNTIYLELYATKEHFNKHIDSYIKILVHELLHGYEDYNRIKNTGQGIYAYYNTKYENSINNINSQNEIKLWLSRCNYFLNNQERNAYLSQLETDIENLFKNDHITIEDFNYTYFKNKLKNTDIWKIYFELGIFILKLYNSNWSDTQKKYVEDIWDDLYNENKRFSLIKKELYNNWQKFEKKFEQLVPKIICKHIETQFKEVAFWVDALSQEKYWENII